MKYTFDFISVLLFGFVSCQQRKTDSKPNEAISEDSLLTLTEAKTFQYFWKGAELASGAARKRFHVDGLYPDNDKHVVTSGGTGLGNGHPSWH